jgi:hypothetical protein
MAGADRQRRQGPTFTLRRLPSSPDPVLAGFAFKSQQGGTIAYLDSVEGAGGTWREVYEPARRISGGVSMWIGEGVTGGRVTLTFSAPLESGRLGWTFDSVAGVDVTDPFVRVRRSSMANDTHQKVVLPAAVSRPVYGFVLVGRGQGAGLVEPGPGVELLGRGEGLNLNVASVWSPSARTRISASWGLQASNLIIGVELRPA